MVAKSKAAKTAKTIKVQAPLTEPAPAAPTFGAVTAVVEAAATRLCGELPTLAESIGERGQAVLAEAFALRAVIAKAAAALEAWERAAKGLREAGKAFPVGEYAVDYPTTTRRTPAWKSEAVRQAEALAQATGKTFAADAYVQQVQDATPATTSVGVRVIRANG